MSREPLTVRELRRGQIVAAARAIVAEEGLDALTFAALERRLSFTRGAITWHFRNKDEIVRALLQDVVEQIDRDTVVIVHAEPLIADRARALVGAMTRGWLSSNAGSVLLSFWGKASADAEASALNAALYQRYRDYSSRLVRLGQERGEFSPDIDADAMGAVIVGLVQGLALQELFQPGSIDLDAAIDAAASAVVARLTARG